MTVNVPEANEIVTEDALVPTEKDWANETVVIPEKTGVAVNPEKLITVAPVPTDDPSSSISIPETTPSRLEPSPKKAVAFILLIPVIFVALSPTILPLALISPVTVRSPE